VYRRQAEELDALSASVQRIGGVGLTIHEELVGQVPSNIIRKIYLFVFPLILFVIYSGELKSLKSRRIVRGYKLVNVIQVTFLPSTLRHMHALVSSFLHLSVTFGPKREAGLV
jgi:hypothetical protein